MRKRYWLGIAISVLLVYLMVRSVELAEVARALTEAEFAFLVPAIALYFAGVFARTLRWAILLRPVQRLGLRRLFVVLVVGFTANDLLPLRAGEAVRAYLLWRKERLEPGATLATIVVERVFDGLVLTGFLLVAGLLIPLETWLTQLAWVAGGVFVFAVGAVWALTVIPGPLMALVAKALSPLPARIYDLILRLLSTFVDGLGILRRGRDTATVAALSCAAWVLEAGMYYVLMFSFPFTPSFVASLLGTAVANLASMVPSSPGYVGTFDLGLLAVLAGTFRVDPSIGAAYTTLVHSALILPVVILGLFFVWREGLSLRRITSKQTTSHLDDNDSAGSAEIAPRRTSP